MFSIVFKLESPKISYVHPKRSEVGNKVIHVFSTFTLLDYEY